MAIITCPQCRAENRETGRYCAECGAPLPGSKPLNPAQPPSDEADAGIGIGTLLAERYRMISELGRGGFGAVYKAWDTRLNRAVAVKENLQSGADSQRQFIREAQVLADLNHPNLPRVIDYFSIPGKAQYLVMDFVEGDDLHSQVERQRSVELQQVLAWTAQVCDALEYLHNHEPPLFHRDIKPANIRINSKGRAMLVDFGLVKAYNPSMKTTVGARAVSPGYAPPEQYGMGSTDERSDIYALGATLYYLLTCNNPPESVQRLTGKSTPAIHQFNSQVPGYVVLAVERAMALDPAQRFQRAAEFKTALQPPAPPAVVQVAHQPAAAELYPATRVAPAPVSVAIPPAAAPGSTQVVPPVGELRPADRGAVPPAAAPGSTQVVSPVQAAGARPAPGRKTGVWLALGGGLVVILLGLAALAGGYYFWRLAAATPEAAAGAATPAAKVIVTASSSDPVKLENWTSQNFKLLYYSCYQATKCWKYAPQKNEPGEWRSVAQVWIDPGWQKPGLVFWHDYNLGPQDKPGEIFVLAEDAENPASNGAAMPVLEKISGGANSGWEEKRIDLSKYAGKRIIIRFHANGSSPQYWTVSDIMVGPNLAP